MKKIGLLNQPLSEVIAGLGHTDTLVIADAGLPVPAETQRIDLTLIGEGHANKEIARLLVISEKTVKNHIGNIFSKLHVCDRTQAVLYAIRKGLVKV